MPATVRTSLLIALAALCAHAGALSAGWIWDDGDYITANRIVQSSDGFLTLWLPGATPQFYPLVFLGFWIEHAIVGNDPWLYHANNMLLHAGSALLLWLVLRRIGVPLAAWIAVVFAVHPMGVESVAWATERKNTQSLLLALASVLAFLRAEKIDAREPAPAKEAAGQGAASGSLAPYALALLLYIAALLSKTTAVFVAPSLVLIALATRRSIDSRFVVRVAPYFVIGAALGLFTAFLEKTHVGAKGADFALSSIDRLQVAAQNIIFYARIFAVPVEQIFVYPRWTIDATHPAHWAALIGMLLVLAACLWAWRITRAPLLILLWTCAALFPALGFFDVWPFRFSFVADHFAYAAMPALATILVLAVHYAVRALGAEARVRDAVLCAFVIACVPLSWIAAQKYADVETLWRDTIARNPRAWLAHNNLATVLLERAGESLRDPRQEGASERVRALAEEALVHARTAYELKEDDVTHPANTSEALRLLGRYDEALEANQRAIELAPHLSSLRFSRGVVFEAMGRADDARAAYRDALGEGVDRKSELEALRALRRLAVERKELTEAVAHARRLVELEPASGDALADLGSLLLASGDAEGGRAALRAAISESAGFSSEQVMIATSVRYLRAVMAIEPVATEIDLARAVASRLATLAPSDPSVRFLALAIEARAGDPTARGKLAQLEASARAANAMQWADEIAAFLASLPPAK